MGNATIILVLGLGLNVGLLSYTLLSRSGDAVENYTIYYETTMAKNIANTAVDLTLQKLRDNATWRDGFQQVPFGENSQSGTLSSTLTDTAVGGKDYINVVAIGSYSGQSDTVVVLVSPEFVPDVVRGAFTAFGPLDDTISDMQIDGRDHDINGDLLPSPTDGVFGISSATDFVNTQDAVIGGTDAGGVDHEMDFPEDPEIIEENFDWGGTFPSGPDEVLGLPEGTLKAIAQSGANGSQYFTNYWDPPWIEWANNKFVSPPLRGVTFIEVPPGTEWRKMRISPDSEGIFIFHSSDTDAYWNDINLFPDVGEFKGLMIFDKVFHIHMDILGALVILTPNTVVGKNCNGNQDHKIFYSSEAIENAVEDVGGGEYEIVSYWE